MSEQKKNPVRKDRKSKVDAAGKEKDASGAIRLRNLRSIIEHRFGGVPARIVPHAGVKPPQLYRYLSEGAQAHQYPGEKFCRRLEESLGLPRLWMDQDHPAAASDVVLRSKDNKNDNPFTFDTGAPPNGRMLPVSYKFVGSNEDGAFSLEKAATREFAFAYTSDQGAYIARVVGHWNAPRIRHGEYLVVSPGMKIDPGDDVVVRMCDGRNMFKKLSADRGDAWELASINDVGRPVIVIKSDVEAIHGVAGILPAKTELQRPA
jgi:SOS-response transcriptional repressor LexA